MYCKIFGKEKGREPRLLGLLKTPVNKNISVKTISGQK